MSKCIETSKSESYGRLRKPTFGEGAKCEVFEDEFDKRIFGCIEKFATGQPKHCMRNAIRHMECAWKIKDIDPEMSVFRAITAEEEAATAIFLSLKSHQYEHADKIKFKDHSYKQALEPFIYGIAKFIDEASKLDGFPIGKMQLKIEDEGGKQRLSVSFVTGDEMFTCIPPLGFELKINDKPYHFEKELREIATGKSKTTILKHVKDLSASRNTLLYAQPKGRPSIEGNIEGHLKKRQRTVIRFMRIYALIYPYKERAIFVQQALNAFLNMMGEIELDLDTVNGDA